MRTKTARITAAVVGIGALLLAAIGPALYWQEIRVQYHLYSLRNDAEYLKEVVTAPESSLQRLAMTRFLETADGKERLFKLFLETNERLISRVSSSVRKGGATGFTESEDGVIAARWTEQGFELLIHPQSRTGMDEQFRASLECLLRYLVGRSFTSEELMDFVFSFEDAEELGEDRGSLRYFGFPDHATRVTAKRATPSHD